MPAMLDTAKLNLLKQPLSFTLTLQQLIDMVLNVNGYNNWQYHTLNAHSINRISHRELIYYFEVVAP